MYTGKYQTPTRKRHRRRRKHNFPAFFVGCVLVLLCIHVMGKAVNAIGDLFQPDIPILTAPTKPMPTFSRDTTPPELWGVQDITVYAGDTIAYRKDVTVTDDQDPNPSLEVDSSSVDLDTPGTYDVVYTASDTSGNTVCLKAAVTVLAREEGFVPLDTISDTAATLLDGIIWSGASTEEQVRAIYSWIRSHISYGGHSDRTDWHQTGYSVLMEMRGDCYGFFAVAKLLFEQLDIPNIDVTKVKNNNSDSEHFWSLVSVDGGESYYHFDSTPRKGEGDDFCLVTDDFLDTYSRAHNNCHNRDKALYPATPKEALK